MANLNFPKKVFLREDGPREGFQMESNVVPTQQKIELINALSETGIQSIEVTSFVRPDRVPQLADAEQVVQGFKPKAGVRYRALYLNEKGFERGLKFSQLSLEGYLLVAASEKFLRKNNNQSLADVLATVPGWITAFKQHQLKFERVMVSTAFGDLETGAIDATIGLSVIEQVLNKILEHQSTIEEVTLADTTGLGNPESVKRLVGGLKEKWPNIEVGLHLHDTRGTGMANVYAGLEMGVARFDCSVGGMGGCPFAKGAAGNVPTEDVAYLCEELGISTGLDLTRYVECARLAEQILDRKLPGKLKDAWKKPC